MNFPHLPVLIYHKLSFEYNRNKYVLSADDFRRHLDEIKSLRLKPATADQLAGKIQSKASNYDRYLLLTFDDGNSSDYDIAFPALSACYFVATFFITTDWIGHDGYMHSSQLIELSRQGMSIQSHAHTHKFLDEMSEKELHLELQQSKEILEDIVGREVSCLSIPGGRCNTRVIDYASKIGYKTIFTSIPFQLTQSLGVTLVGRVGLRNPMSINEYKKYLIPTKSTIIHLKTEYFFKTKLRSLLGGRLYYYLWKAIVKK